MKLSTVNLSLLATVSFLGRFLGLRPSLNRSCSDGLAAVFRLKEEPWIHADAASADEIIATIQKCPSGALSYSVDDVEQGDRDGGPTLFVAPNGPYVVSGGPDLGDTTRAEGAAKKHFTLCRCGGSKNKPFCDGTHWQIEFKDDQN